MPYSNGNRITLAVSTSTIGDNTIIAAPTSGYIAIDFITLNPDGGAQTITFKNIQALADNTQSIAFALNDNQPLTFENAIHDPKGILNCPATTAFVLNLGAGTSVTGFIKYRIVGN